MWGRKKDQSKSADTPQPLKDAVREARIEAAERSGVVVDLRDADVARLDLLNDAIGPLFDEVPDDVDLFDRGVSKGDIPRLWIDVVAHVEMGRDKRQYRFVQDTRYGRAVLAESYEMPAMADAIKRYVARRLVERERALADDAGRRVAQAVLYHGRRQRRWRAVGMFTLGLVAGIAALVALAMLTQALADQTDLVLLHDPAPRSRDRAISSSQRQAPRTPSI